MVERWMGMGAWCAPMPGPADGISDQKHCPRYVFGVGTVDSRISWVAFFNSRAPRLRPAKEEWLEALRGLLPAAAAAGLGLVSSVGTLTYDLVTAFSQRVGLPLCLWLPMPLEEILGGAPWGRFEAPIHASARLTCLTGAHDCSASTRAVCRDRLLAELADLHCLLKIRRKGNMERMLEMRRSAARKPRWVLGEDTPGRVGASDFFTKTGKGGGSRDELTFVAPSRHWQGASMERWRPPAGKPNRLPTANVDWSRFLYHYTRACAGPWPGQSHESYLADLLDDAPHARHTALDTLMRILGESRIRASAKLLKGSVPAVSLTSIAPMELTRLRHWNKTLARWTIEPYGIGIDKALLRRSGAKPVIYGSPVLYGVLKAKDRFRYQKHQPPGSLWRQEREWRLPHDLSLQGIPSDQRVLFVPTRAEVCLLSEGAGMDWTVVCLDE